MSHIRFVLYSVGFFFLIFALSSQINTDDEISNEELIQLRMEAACWPEMQETILKALEDYKINYSEHETIKLKLEEVKRDQTKDELIYFLKGQISARLVRQNGERSGGNCKEYRPKLFPRVPCSPDPPTPSSERPKKTQTGKNWVRSCPGYLQRNGHDQVVNQSKGELEYDSSPNPTACTERFFPQVASSDKR